MESESHLGLGVGVIYHYYCFLFGGCAVQAALQFPWNFQPSATGALPASRGRAWFLLSDLITSCLPHVVSRHLVLQWLQTHLLCSWAFRVSPLQSPGGDAYLPWHWVVCWPPIAQLIDSTSSINTSLLQAVPPPLLPLALRRDCKHSWQLEASQLPKLSGSIWYTKGTFFSEFWGRALCRLWPFLSAIAQLQWSLCPHSVNYAQGLAAVWEVCGTSGMDALPCPVRNWLKTEGQSTIWSVPICHFQKDLKFLKLCFQGHLSHLETTFCVITKAVLNREWLEVSAVMLL